jgi:hypothetical protein
MKPSVGQKYGSGKPLAYLQHHEMFLLEEQNEVIGQQVVAITCFHWAAHAVPSDIWEKLASLNNYSDLQSCNNVYNPSAW